jgi:hydrogenase maturation protease
MTRVRVAGVGNVFFHDDGFGVEVAHVLATAPPPDTTVTDIGIRAIHFAYDLLEPVSLCIVADCMTRGGAPGTLYVIEPEVDGEAGTLANAHGMNLPIVFAALRELGGVLPPLLVVGCEPQTIEPGIGLSATVRAAVPAAAKLIRDLITSHQEVSPC